jgi:two-component system, chemotaxis family, response regulator WspF
MRVAIVNDVPLIAESLRQIVVSQPELSVAWTALDGEEAVRKCAADRPDLILMDLRMPRMDGIEATRQIMSATPCAILIVTATVEGSAPLVFRAMGYGALDAVNTPVAGKENVLLAKMRRIGMLTGKLSVARRNNSIPPMSIRMPIVAPPPAPPLVVIGSSTGGPRALADVFSRMHAPLGAAVVVVQHVDEEFASGLAGWLADQSPFPVRIAVAGDRPKAGEVLLAASNDHLVVNPDLTLGYTPRPVENPYRPSVDVFFQKVATHWPRPGVAVLLTGMGNDGGLGLLALRKSHWHTIAQDRATSVIYGMPKAAADLQAAIEILPVTEIGRAIESRVPVVVR